MAFPPLLCHRVVHLHGVPLLVVVALGHPMVAIIARTCCNTCLAPPRVRKMKKSMPANLLTPSKDDMSPQIQALIQALQTQLQQMGQQMAGRWRAYWRADWT